MTKVLKVFESELRAMAYEANHYSDCETGGDLFGLWLSNGNPVVFLATGQGSKAKRHIAKYEMDVEYMLKCEEILLAKFGIHYLGDWHSHHNLNLCQPSGGDQQRIKTICNANGRTSMCEIIITHVLDDRCKERLDAFVYTNNYLNNSSIDVLETKISPIRKALTEQNSHAINLINGQLSFNDLLLTTQKNIQSNYSRNSGISTIGSDIKFAKNSIKIELER